MGQIKLGVMFSLKYSEWVLHYQSLKETEQFNLNSSPSLVIVSYKVLDMFVISEFTWA